MFRFRNLPFCIVVLTALAALAPPRARADIFGTYGDTTVVNAGPPTVYQLVSDTSGVGYAGVEDQITGTLNVAELTDLEANYEMTTGTFGGGAPRFTLFDTSFNSAYVYWGTPTGGGSFADPNLGSSSLNGTGNYADLASSDIRVYSNGFGGDNSANTGVTWATFVGLVGTSDLTYITLDLDGGFAGTQAMKLDNFTVNGVVVSNETATTPEPSALVLLFTFMAVIGGMTFRYKRQSKALRRCCS